MKLWSCFVVTVVGLVGCSSPDVSLWRIRPSQIDVKEELVVPGDLVGGMKIYVPKGLYRFTRTDDLGFVYECEGAVARAVDNGFGVNRRPREFRPAIVLYNRSDEVLIMQVAYSLEEIGPKGGEIGDLVVRRAIERNGYILVPRSRGLAAHQRTAIGLSSKQR